MSTTAVASPNGNGDPANVAAPDALPSLGECVNQLDRVEKSMNKEIVEQRDYVDALILGMISRTHTYAQGTGGVAKTHGARNLSEHFTVPFFFLPLRPDTKREEAFGPLKVTKLQQDIYEHDVTGYLPSAVAANLDEFADGARFTRQFLNIMAEREFVNGRVVIKVALRTVIGTTNFWIEESTLEALFDRFAQRLIIEPVKTSRGFKSILKGQVARDADEAKGVVRADARPKVTAGMLAVLTNAVLTCRVDDEIYNAIDDLRLKAAKEGVHISPRRWGEGLKLARAQAVRARRDYVIEDDLRIYHRTLLNTPDDAKIAKDLVKHLRDKMTAVVEDVQRDVDKLNARLQPQREKVAAGTNADFDELVEGNKQRMTLLRQIEDVRTSHNGGKPHAGLDALKADLENLEGFLKSSMGFSS